MINKLTYKKIADSIIEIDLLNGYTIIAIRTWNKNTHDYTVQLRLKENTIDRWDVIEKAQHLKFNNNYKFINSAILKHVSDLLYDGFFDYYIERYKYEMKCFEMGDEINSLPYYKEG